VSHLGERVVSGPGEIEELGAEKAKDKALSDLIQDHNQARHVSGHEFTRAEQPSGCVKHKKKYLGFSPDSVSTA